MSTKPKASGISDEEFLAIVREFNEGRAPECQEEPFPGPHWAQIWDMEKRFPDLPTKVLRAKARSLMKRGLIGGCSCGCRGDYAVPESDLYY
jgi:hypothetical protein